MKFSITKKIENGKEEDETSKNEWTEYSKNLISKVYPNADVSGDSKDVPSLRFVGKYFRLNILQ
jgi:hypothetical protein